ncbi:MULTISPECIES: MFS transporter [unclassified Sphingopyxis]|uniref:MFS transporter n=1 Tax=unclassified Sphingopyxis TaxID=2614943 RepID=UPI0006FFEE48|nr:MULTISPECIES: MFS transporter [unclassified Sphingopyxis]
MSFTTEPNRPQLSSIGEWRSHGSVALVAALGLAFGTIHIYSQGVFLTPIAEDLGWSRSRVSSGFLIGSVLAVIAGPLVGTMIDRWGCRPIALTGFLIYAMGLGSLSWTETSFAAWIGAWLLIALGAVLLKPTVWTAAVVSRFERSRGLALAATLSGLSISTALTPLIANELLEAHGWRAAFQGLAAIIVCLALPMVLIFFKDPPRATPPAASVHDLRLSRLGGLQYMKSRSYFQLLLSSVLIGIPIAALLMHHVPILVSLHIPKLQAVQIASLIGVGSLVGRLMMGQMLDRFKSTLVAASAFSLPAFPILGLIWFGDSAVMASLCALLIGFSVGAEIDILAFLVSRRFPAQFYGLLFGTISGTITFAVASGNFLGSAVFDLTGSYSLLLILAIPSFLASALCILLLPVATNSACNTKAADMALPDAERDIIREATAKFVSNSGHSSGQRQPRARGRSVGAFRSKETEE